MPRGDGHAVLVLPGKYASDLSTRQLRQGIRDLGYDARGWDLGRNHGLTPEVIAGLPALLEQTSESSGGLVSLVGWSLGGVFARGLAARMPGQVRQVISLGSPLAPREASPIGARARPLPVPSTSIYSPTDRIVPWPTSLQTETATAENVAVASRHVGLGTNPAAMWVIADRLAQPAHSWRQFDPSTAPAEISAMFLPTPSQE